MSNDANGNLAARTDFNGRTTVYTYDNMNELLAKTPDAFFGAAAVTFTTFEKLAEDFEENEGIVVELQDELFAIRYVATEAQADGLWWGTQMFNSAQDAINALALNPQWGTTAEEIVFGVIPKNAQLIMGYAASQGSLSGGAFQILADSQTLITIALTE